MNKFSWVLEIPSNLLVFGDSNYLTFALYIHSKSVLIGSCWKSYIVKSFNNLLLREDPSSKRFEVPHLKHVKINDKRLRLSSEIASDRWVSWPSRTMHPPSWHKSNKKKTLHGRSTRKRNAKKMRTTTANFKNKLQSSSKPNWTWFNYYFAAVLRES